MSYNHGPTTDSKIAQLQIIVDEWNAVCPMGTPVVRYKLIRPLREPQTTKTRSVAWLLSGHTAVVMVEGVSGCVALESVVPITEPTDKQREDLAPLA